MSPLPATLRACLKSYPRTRVHASPCGRAGKPTKTAGSTSKNSTCDLAQPLDSAGGWVRPGRLGVAAPADSESTGWPSMANLLCEPTPRHRQSFVRHHRVLLNVNVEQARLRNLESLSVVRFHGFEASGMRTRMQSIGRGTATHFPQEEDCIARACLLLTSRGQWPGAWRCRGMGSHRRRAMDGRPVDPESAWSGYAGATRARSEERR